MKHLPRTIIAYIASIILMSVVIGLNFKKLPPQIPLFYSLPTSETQIVDTWFIIFIPAISFILININNILAKGIFKRDQFILKLVYITDLTIIFFTTYIFIKIVLLIT